MRMASLLRGATRYPARMRGWWSALLLGSALASCDGELRFAAEPGADAGGAADAISGDGSTAESGVGCKEDADCPFRTLYCDKSSGQCHACLNDDQCKSGDLRRCDLSAHRCVECDPAAKPSDCGSDEICEPTARRCRASCTAAGAECEESTAPVCYPGGFCGCSSKTTSTASSCNPLSDRKLCNSTTGACVECVLDADCEDGRCFEGACVRCLVNADCGGKRCEPTTHQCVD